jgi:hypothetical protein
MVDRAPIDQRKSLLKSFALLAASLPRSVRFVDCNIFYKSFTRRKNGGNNATLY